MSYRIAITGKGGTGKTTLAGLITLRLIARGRRPVLAVDADPNSCLDSVLGVAVKNTIGAIREQAKQISGTGKNIGISKHQLLEMKIAESIVEAEDFDLIAMGRSEGPGCYCYANNVLKSAITVLTSHYPYVILDNEAGLENLSRRIIQKVELLVIVSDPSRKGLETAERLFVLAQEMDIKYNKLAILVNQFRQIQLPEFAEKVKNTTCADIITGFPDNIELAEIAAQGLSLKSLSPANELLQLTDEFLDKLGFD